MSKSIKETFVTIINEGYKSTASITDPFNKATALASLGQAIALSGLLSTTTTMAETTEGTVEATGKDSLKAEAGKGTKKTASKSKAKTTKKDEVPPVNEIPPVEEETEVEIPPVEEDTAGEVAPVTEGELSEEWTEEMSELKSEQLEVLQAYVDAWEASYVYGECIPAFFEDGSIEANEENYYEYIRPTNIDGFLSYLAALSSDEE